MDILFKSLNLPKVMSMIVYLVSFISGSHTFI